MASRRRRRPPGRGERRLRPTNRDPGARPLRCALNRRDVGGAGAPSGRGPLSKLGMFRSEACRGGTLRMASMPWRLRPVRRDVASGLAPLRALGEAPEARLSRHPLRGAGEGLRRSKPGQQGEESRFGRRATDAGSLRGRHRAAPACCCARPRALGIRCAPPAPRPVGPRRGRLVLPVRTFAALARAVVDLDRPLARSVSGANTPRRPACPLALTLRGAAARPCGSCEFRMKSPEFR